MTLRILVVSKPQGRIQKEGEKENLPPPNPLSVLIRKEMDGGERNNKREKMREKIICTGKVKFKQVDFL